MEAYGIPQNFLEENNPFIEYAKKKGIENNFMFENLFNDIKTYINAKSSKRRKNLFQFNKNNNNEAIDINKYKDNKENIDADGDLIIESESDDDNNNDNNENKNDSKKNENKNKGSKHCVFDSKKILKLNFLKMMTKMKKKMISEK